MANHFGEYVSNNADFNSSFVILIRVLLILKILNLNPLYKGHYKSPAQNILFLSLCSAAPFHGSAPSSFLNITRQMMTSQSWQTYLSDYILWHMRASSWDFGTYRICLQQRRWRACKNTVFNILPLLPVKFQCNFSKFQWNFTGILIPSFV